MGVCEGFAIPLLNTSQENFTFEVILFTLFLILIHYLYPSAFNCSSTFR